MNKTYKIKNRLNGDRIFDAGEGLLIVDEWLECKTRVQTQSHIALL